LDAALPLQNVSNNLPLSTSRNQDVREKIPLSTSATTLLRAWRQDDNDINAFPFNPKSDIIGINLDLFDVLLNGTHLDFFKLIVSDDIIIKIVEEIQNWLGLVLWIGIVEMPEIEMHWSNSTLFSTSFGKIISRNRFQSLTPMIHYQNNETVDKNNRLYKLDTLIDDVMINSNNCVMMNLS